MPSMTPTLWFDMNAEEAITFWASVVPDTRIDNVVRAPSDTPSNKECDAMVVSFTLNGQAWTGINGGPQFPFNEQISFALACEDQAEVDAIWDNLTEGGTESMCGWCKDRYGFSWQVVPKRLYDLLADPDPDRARRASEFMLTQHGKLNIAAIEAAADG